MKIFLYGLAIVLLGTTILVFNQDYRQNRYFYKELKFVAEEVSATGALYQDNVEYSQGRKVFNQTEAIKAMDYQIKKLLSLDNNFNPLPNSYWTEKVTYKAYFFDDSNTTFPYVFNDPDSLYSITMVDPEVIVTINAGKARYRLPLFKVTGNFIKTAGHEWKSRK